MNHNFANSTQSINSTFSEPAPAAEVPAQLERLALDLGALQSTVQTLTERLAPVLRVPPPSTESKSSTVRPVAQTPLASQILELRDRLGEDVGRLQLVVQMLEL